MIRHTNLRLLAVIRPTSHEALKDRVFTIDGIAAMSIHEHSAIIVSDGQSIRIEPYIAEDGTAQLRWSTTL